MSSRLARPALVAIPLAALTLALTPGFAAADNGTDTSALRSAVTTSGVLGHLQELQDIADANDGNRAAGTTGHEASADYVEELLDAAGYDVWRQEFSYTQWIEDAEPELDQVSPNATTYVAEEDFSSMSYSGSGDVTAPLEAVDLVLPPVGGSTSGCEASDFAGFVAGDIALLQRGTCDFVVKAQNAEDAGASGVIIFNEGNAPDRIDVLFGTLGEGAAVTIPVVGTSFEVGNDLAALLAVGGVTMHVLVTAHLTDTTTENVLADTVGGRGDRIVVAGGHLDSVVEGPGINDNGSGTATLLEVALQMAELDVTPRNRVRFAFWSGEEDGLIGSTYYVSQLSAGDRKKHALNLNFDMIGSPNFVRFVYDGDGSATGASGPNGSANIEGVFNDYFASQSLKVEATAFDGRSDYGPFIAAGIPAGGLFTGAEDIKTAQEAADYGGLAGDPYDPCYHQACDGINNLSHTALDQMSDAVAHSVLTFAQSTSAVNGANQGNGGGASESMDRKGARHFK